MKKPKILIIGSYLAGLTMRMKDFPVPGQTIMGYQFEAAAGGKGSNQAVACARLGADVSFAGCIGNDDFGKSALALWASENVDASKTKVMNDAKTGLGFILVNDAGENMITLDIGACGLMNKEFVDSLKDAVKEADFVLSQQEIPVEGVLEIARVTKEAGKTFILNPAPYRELPKEIFPLTDVIVPNLGEARQIVGLDPEDESKNEAEIADMIKALGCKTVVITLGSKGAYFSCPEKSGFSPARKVKAADTTGAGDTFTAALSVALSEGKDLDSAVSFAQHAASISVTAYGVIDSLPFRKQLEE